ncbi:MAG: GNAT family N-acetyltransferase, partial [Dehalococcoidia bacterium]
SKGRARGYPGGAGRMDCIRGCCSARRTPDGLPDRRTPARGPDSTAARFVRPRSVRIDQAGHAVEPPGGNETYRGLYAALAPNWLAAGCFTDYVELPAGDREALEAWYALGFGQEETRALGFVDAGAKNRVNRETAGPAGTSMGIEAGPEHCIHLDDAFVETGACSTGAGSVLLEVGLDWARREGFDSCTVSWRTQNLSAGRFWPRNGWKPVRYQLSHTIDERIAWAGARMEDVGGRKSCARLAIVQWPPYTAQ